MMLCDVQRAIGLLDCLFSSVQVRVDSVLMVHKYPLPQLLPSAEGSCSLRCYYLVSDSDAAAQDTLCSP